MLAGVLKLALAVVALVVSWRWLRAEISRAFGAGEPLRPSALAVRGAVWLASAIWCLLVVAGTFGRVFGWILGLALVAAAAWYFLGRSGSSKPTSDGSDGSGSEPPRNDVN